MDDMIKGSCHCGTVTFEIAEAPVSLVSCNCSICRRLAALWAHSPPAKVSSLNVPEGATTTYVQGDKMLAIHTCKTCGCTTHWSGQGLQGSSEKIALNCRLADPADIENIPIRNFDGADSWQFLD